MTRAPDCLLDVRVLLLTHLGAAGLESAEVGIVGDAAHVGEGDSYHLGLPEQDPDGYAVAESSRDRAGLDEHAAAVDVGGFRVTTAAGTFDLPHFSRWLVDQCKAGTADTRDIREVIYSPDGEVVRRWDRLGRRTSGDSSHRWHSHVSYHRDAIKAGRDQTPVVRRYLTTIGLIEGEDMPLTDADQPVIRAAVHSTYIGRTGVTIAQAIDSLRSVPAEVVAIRAGQAAILAAIEGLDTAAIMARIEAVAVDVEQLADLVGRLEAGELTAEQVLVKLRDLLPVA